MTWSEFKSQVNELLTVERGRLGAQPFIDRQLRLGVGDVQRLIDYYRTGFVTTLDADDVVDDGFASRGKLPPGAFLRELHFVRSGIPSSVRPLYVVHWSNRHELIAGFIGIGARGRWFRYSVDPRGAQDVLFYPAVTAGYAIQITWDALLGRSASADYRDDDIVPFDEPVTNLVHQYVKMTLAREVDRDLPMARDYERTYRQGISSLYSEIQERLRLKRAASEANCAPGCCPTVTGVVDNFSVSGCGSSVVCNSDPLTTKPATQWVMLGDSGELDTIDDTTAVARAALALNPDFVIHMGDAIYGSNGVSGGSPQLANDMFVRHWWNYINDERMYFAWGNHDLQTDYGSAFLSLLPNVATLIGDQADDQKYWYTFVQGPVRFFVLNSGIEDDDDNIFFDEQAEWLWNAACAATEKWLICVYHRPQYTSDVGHNPGSTLMRGLDLHAMGFDLVVNGHAHDYERIVDSSGLTHVICGLGGALKRDAALTNLPTGSQFFYNEKNGFLRFSATDDLLQFEFQTIDGQVLDRVSIDRPDPRVSDCQTNGYT